MKLCHLIFVVRLVVVIQEDIFHHPVKCLIKCLIIPRLRSRDSMYHATIAAIHEDDSGYSVVTTEVALHSSSVVSPAMNNIQFRVVQPKESESAPPLGSGMVNESAEWVRDYRRQGFKKYIVVYITDTTISLVNSSIITHRTIFYQASKQGSGA